MNLSKLIPHLIYEFSNEAELVRAVNELSQKFTTDREKIGDYLKDPRLTSAYTAFYLTTNLPKFEAILPWFSQEVIEEFRRCSLIDLGSGPGTFSLAFRLWKGEGEILQIETSKIMLEQSKRLWEGLFPGESLLQNQNLQGNAPRLMLFGHSANEMGIVKVMKYIQEYDPDHILFIEPGTKAFFSEMLKIRSSLLEGEYEIHFPCPRSESCPLENSEDWCHQYIKVRQDPEIERLSQIAGKDRRNLPLIVHLYSKTLKVQKPSERILRVYPETKFSFEWDVCHENEKEHYQLQKRGMSKSRQKEISEFRPGDGIQTEVEKEFNGTKRVSLKV